MISPLYFFIVFEEYLKGPLFEHELFVLMIWCRIITILIVNKPFAIEELEYPDIDINALDRVFVKQEGELKPQVIKVITELFSEPHRQLDRLFNLQVLITILNKEQILTLRLNLMQNIRNRLPPHLMQPLRNRQHIQTESIYRHID